jgi:hypothetical protein
MQLGGGFAAQAIHATRPAGSTVMASSDTALIIARHEQSPPSAWFHRLDYRFVAGAAMMERLLDRGSYKSKQKPRGDVDAPVRELGVRARSRVACPGSNSAAQGAIESTSARSTDVFSALSLKNRPCRG